MATYSSNEKQQIMLMSDLLNGSLSIPEKEQVQHLNFEENIDTKNLEQLPISTTLKTKINNFIYSSI